jgi:hypothetical protein
VCQTREGEILLCVGTGCERRAAGTEFTCFTSTKVQILTPEELLCQLRAQAKGQRAPEERGGHARGGGGGEAEEEEKREPAML